MAEKPPVAGETSEKGARVPTVWAGDSTAEALLAAHNYYRDRGLVVEINRGRCKRREVILWAIFPACVVM